GRINAQITVLDVFTQLSPIPKRTAIMRGMYGFGSRSSVSLSVGVVVAHVGVDSNIRNMASEKLMHPIASVGSLEKLRTRLHTAPIAKPTA
ncbi:hypothetical protein PENTCL1PPCAC_16224, partial [Pristionchus entomophagus]